MSHIVCLFLPLPNNRSPVHSNQVTFKKGNTNAKRFRRIKRRDCTKDYLTSRNIKIILLLHSFFRPLDLSSQRSFSMVTIYKYITIQIHTLIILPRYLLRPAGKSTPANNIEKKSIFIPYYCVKGKKPRWLLKLVPSKLLRAASHHWDCNPMTIDKHF